MTRFAIAIAAAIAAPSVATAATVDVTVENVNGDGGFFFTPFWGAFHNGGFDSYDGGAPASDFPGITEIAEGGDTGPISAAFAGSAAGLAGGQDFTLTAVSAPGDAPVFSPGESATQSYNVADPATNRWFSYASMVIPSNDLFVANGSPTAHTLFNADGSFAGPLEILIFGSEVNDNSTELNDADGGAAFSALGGSDTAETGNIRNFFTVAGDADYLADFLGTDTANGATISSTFGPNDLIARITITPTPGAATTLMGAGLLAGMRRRRA